MENRLSCTFVKLNTDSFVLKKKILLWLAKNKIRSLEEFGKVTNLYYRNNNKLIEAVSKNDKTAIFGGK